VNGVEVPALYSELWNEYIAKNPALIAVLTSPSGVVERVRPGHVWQATELWRIRATFSPVGATIS
jgi:hypothetical protein